MPKWKLRLVLEKSKSPSKWQKHRATWFFPPKVHPSTFLSPAHRFFFFIVFKKLLFYCSCPNFLLLALHHPAHMVNKYVFKFMVPSTDRHPAPEDCWKSTILAPGIWGGVWPATLPQATVKTAYSVLWGEKRDCQVLKTNAWQIMHFNHQVRLPDNSSPCLWLPVPYLLYSVHLQLFGCRINIFY